MILLQNISFGFPGGDLLFNHINLTVPSHTKSALVGSNGMGKSTMLKIIANEIQPLEGSINIQGEIFYVPQMFGNFNHLTIAECLNIDQKLFALEKITSGEVDEQYFELLNDDWDIEERCQNALQYWNLQDFDLNQKLEGLSGGQKTKVFLAGIQINQPEIIILDEPTNHLDLEGRKLLYDLIEKVSATVVIVSHDRTLLNLVDTIFELSNQGIATYGGNYDFYTEQKEVEDEALQNDIHAKERALKKAKEKERETLERKQKLDARGKQKQEKSGVARIMMNTLRNNAEKNTSKLKSVHTEKISGISGDLRDLRSSVRNSDQMKVNFNDSGLHSGKVLITAEYINFSYGEKKLWKENLDLEVRSGDRISIKGSNGSGKTTLIKLLLGSIKPSIGNISITEFNSIYIDQEYSLIDNELTLYDFVQTFNDSTLQESEVKTLLSRFLFSKEMWDKKCGVLSGGERLRLLLCGLSISNKAPDMMILDEPTNNLDLQNVEILTNSIKDYRGTLLVISHDEVFLEEIGIGREVMLE
ncbi:ABC-F family ATP-binding cassette domain-containing protein [Chryseobacterium sp. BIGb0232]|uniref:ABC-F family ATP-binding cassette domain-containing protein n=1 Tax=Chryseobacterium sp. BIGb0232 TaxID=2940598 RepID=UPI000F478757|nr:ABC-F family ATP-binding cassette domain-containing protein [Chryseobacterium sp. BIGb0232]MCS4304893.1 ATPase subunit of ABC transporter with duplicated ATPase domains [Chryseobacterium sp. BIGb0232]ROS09687.1 ATPase subunit of ABC transporter with duplicated ATPase domains [Chryseobacterium nakagawai]